MKRGYITGLSLLFVLAAGTAGCGDEIPRDNGGDHISLSVTTPDDFGPRTRAGVSDIDDLLRDGFGVWTTFGENPTGWQWSGGPTAHYNMHRYDANGVWNFDPPRLWSADPDDYPITFYAIYPISPQFTPGDPFVPTGVATAAVASGSLFYAPGGGAAASHGYSWWLQYSVPPTTASAVTAARQQDVIVGMAQAEQKPISGQLNVEMKHIFSSIGFRVFGDGDMVSSIRVTGVLYDAIFGYNGGDEPSWLHQRVNMVGAGGLVPSTLNTAASADVADGFNVEMASASAVEADATGRMLSDEGRLMMIPQTLGSEARIVVAFEGGGEMNVSLDGQTWEMGDRITYSINCPGVSLRADYPFELPPWVARSARPVMESFEVKCLAQRMDGSLEEISPAADWTLTPAADWIKLSLSPDHSFASAPSGPLSGAGSQTIYIYASDHYDGERQTTVELTSLLGNPVTLNVAQVSHTGGGDLETPTDGGEW